MVYIAKTVFLTCEQKKNLIKAINELKPLKLKIHWDKKGDIKLLLTKTQLWKPEITLTKSQLNKMKSMIVKNIKTGGLIITLPMLTAVASTIGSLIGGASSIANVVNNKKNNDKKLKEQKRHNLAMEEKKGKGFFLKPYKK